MKLAALMMVRNEAAIIADSIGHLLHGVGVDRLYVADNGSTDATPTLLRRMADADRRVEVRHAPGAFRQLEIFGELLLEALADGADWLLPNDADEFLWMGRRRLEALCAGAGPAGGFQLRVRNFVQFRGVRQDRPVRSRPWASSRARSGRRRIRGPGSRPGSHSCGSTMARR